MHCIRDNFKEIYQTLKFPSENPLLLVSNLTSTRIYDSRYGWGRLWRWFHHIEYWLTGHDRHIGRIEKTLHYTQSLFKNEIAKIREHINLYSEYLEKSGKGYTLTESRYFKARDLITEWNSSTRPFLRLLKKIPSAAFSFKEAFHSDTTAISHAYQRMIDLEGFLNGPLPLPLFKKIIREISLNPIEQKEFDRWANKIDKYNVPPKILYKALKTIAALYTKKLVCNKPLKIIAINLGLLLEDKGCKTLQKDDPKHLLWRQNLIKGQKLHINSSEAILGEEIFPALTGSDQTRAYRIEGIPDRIALIAQNSIALPLRDQRMRKETERGIEPALFNELSSDGKIALVENLKPINAIVWTSIEGKISPEDSRIILPLCSLIKKFIDKNITPSNFSSSNLMFDGEWRLKSIKPTTLSPFDFNAIEEFIHICAGNNSAIFRELMVKSGLSFHRTGKFYQETVRNALNGDTIAADDLAGIYKIGDPKVVDRAILLKKNTLDLKKNLMLDIRRASPNLAPADIEKQAIARVLENYQKNKTLSMINHGASKAV